MTRKRETKKGPDDQFLIDNHDRSVSGPESIGDGAGDQPGDATHPADVPALVAGIRELHVRREQAVRMRMRLDNACRAFARRLLGFQTMLPEAQREGIRKRAEALVNGLMKGGNPATESERVVSNLRPMVDATKLARMPFDGIDKACAAKMATLAEQLPGAEFVASVRGFGLAGFAQIVGEAGELSNYANPAKLWKRMGLAVFDGKAQRKSTDAELAVIMGYSPRRRSISWRIGDCLIKGNKGEYYQLYVDRKAMELEKLPADAKGRKLHAHRRAQRYIEKRLMRNLWRAWRGQKVAVTLKLCAAVLSS